MKNNSSTVLVIEDDAAIAEVSRAYLARGGYISKVVPTVREALEVLAKDAYPLVLLDLTLPDGHGTMVLEYLQARMRLRETAVIICTADATMSSAVEAMRIGAYDYLVKPFSADRLITTMGNAKNTLSLQAMVNTMKDQVNRRQFGDFIGGSVPMQLVYQIIQACASSRASVFITGESGTGKEVAARTIHDHSRRNSGPFVAVNCAAIPRDLLESELFGHVKGAFTGALNDRMGAVERALGGTLFLDEICEMPLELQAKLLRFLQGRMYQPVGSNDVRTTNCRIVCATNRDPESEVAAGRFREDLFYRLHVVPLHLPPLRDRRDDILPLAIQMMRRFAAEEGKAFHTLAPDAQQALLQYDWPGNVRQLMNVIQQAVVLHSGNYLARDMLPAAVNHASPQRKPMVLQALLESEQAEFLAQKAANPEARIQPLWEIERRAIEQALSIADGNVQLAADALQISPSTIYRKRQEWAEGMDMPAMQIA